MLNRHSLTYWILATCLIWIFSVSVSLSATGEEKYYEALECYQDILKTSEKLKYRENWFPCIEKFRDGYRVEPSGPYAAASLYMAGKLYLELYNRSYKGTDKTAALDHFYRVLKRFPKSDYIPKAQEGIRALSGKGADKSGKPKGKLKIHLLKRKVRETRFAESKAEYKASKREGKLETKSPKSRTKPKAFVQPANVNTATITGMRFWSNPSYTRVVIDADKETPYVHKLLKEPATSDKPHRLYVDFDNSRMRRDIKKVIPINDDLLSDVRAGLQPSGSVRVVVDIKSFKTYKIFSIRNPFRTVIDVWGGDASRLNGGTVAKKERKRTPAKKRPAREREGKNAKVRTSELTRALALGVRRIVIDPGHGGHDAGAVGYDKHVYEKDVVLKIAKQLAKKIRRELGCEVIMTRNSDRFLSLEERTAIANTKNADLFISIHTNAHENRRAYGIETYFLNLATDDDAVRVAARENATTRKNISDLEKILNDLMHNTKINESSRLAAHVQRSICGRLKKKYKRIKNKGVKQAPFYVLIGAQMPSILIETSFISNKRECGRLTDPTYQERLSEAVMEGIRKYIKETNPTALLRLRPDKM